MSAKMDLSKYGITGCDRDRVTTRRTTNSSRRGDQDPALTRIRKGYRRPNTGAVNVMTGVYTGRSPKDKFFVMDDTTKDTIWWTSDEYKNDNKPDFGPKRLESAEEASQRKELSDKKLYVVDTFCGANENIASEDPLHHGGGLAGALRYQHVHPSDRRGAGKLRRTRFRGAERIESEGEELQGTGPEFGDGGRFQPHRKDAGHHQHLVRRRNEERACSHT